MNELGFEKQERDYKWMLIGWKEKRSHLIGSKNKKEKSHMDKV